MDIHLELFIYPLGYFSFVLCTGVDLCKLWKGKLIMVVIVLKWLGEGKEPHGPGTPLTISETQSRELYESGTMSLKNC